MFRDIDIYSGSNDEIKKKIEDDIKKLPSKIQKENVIEFKYYIKKESDNLNEELKICIEDIDRTQANDFTLWTKKNELENQLMRINNVDELLDEINITIDKDRITIKNGYPKIQITGDKVDITRIFEFAMKTGIISVKTSVEQVIDNFFLVVSDGKIESWTSENYYKNRSILKNEQVSARSENFFEFTKLCCMSLSKDKRDKLSSELIK